MQLRHQPYCKTPAPLLELVFKGFSRAWLMRPGRNYRHLSQLVDTAICRVLSVYSDTNKKSKGTYIEGVVLSFWSAHEIPHTADLDLRIPVDSLRGATRGHTDQRLADHEDQ